MSADTFDLSIVSWALAVFCAMTVGFAKTGVPGVGILAVPVMAMIFPAGASTGIYLPMLIAGDIFAVFWYRSYAQWRYVLMPLFWAIVGIIVGFLAIRHMRFSDVHLKRMIGGIVLFVLALGMYLKRHRNRLELPKTWWFAAAVGILGGFTTMAANAAGPVWIVYLLALQLDKREFLGTNAWIFLILNLFKVPFSYGLGFIGPASLLFDLKMLPAIAAGAFLGRKAAAVIPREWFEAVVRLLAAAAAVNLLLA